MEYIISFKKEDTKTQEKNVIQAFCEGFGKGFDFTECGMDLNTYVWSLIGGSIGGAVIKKLLAGNPVLGTILQLAMIYGTYPTIRGIEESVEHLEEQKDSEG